MKTHTSYLTFNTKKRHEIIDITEDVEKCRAAADITEGMVLVVGNAHLGVSFRERPRAGPVERHSRLARGANCSVVSGRVQAQQRHWRG